MSLTLEINSELGFAQVITELYINIESATTIDLWIKFFEVLENGIYSENPAIQFEIKQLFKMSNSAKSGMQECFEIGYVRGENDCLQISSSEYYNSLYIMRKNYKQSKISDRFSSKFILNSEYNLNLGNPIVEPKGIYAHLLSINSDFSFLENWTPSDLYSIPKDITDYIKNICKYEGEEFLYFQFGFLCGIRRKYSIFMVDRSFYADLKDFIKTYCEQDVKRVPINAASYYSGKIVSTYITYVNIPHINFTVKIPGAGIDICYRDLSKYKKKVINFMIRFKSIFTVYYLTKQIADKVISYSPENDLMSVLAYQLFSI